MTSGLYVPMLLAMGAGYLLGSIPFGLILTRLAGLGDVRAIGSGNIGATNVLRTGRKGLAAATLLLDGLKGTAAVVLVGNVLAPWLLSFAGARPLAGPDPALSALLNMVEGTQIVTLAAGLGAFLGHIYPVWLGFKGGKGVATYIGVLAALVFKMALVFAAVWLAVAALTRYSSAAALAAAAVTPIALWFTGYGRVGLVLGAMSLLLYWTHRENIRRLRNGTESKIGAKSSKPAPVA